MCWIPGMFKFHPHHACSILHIIFVLELFFEYMFCEVPGDMKEAEKDLIQDVKLR